MHDGDIAFPYPVLGRSDDYTNVDFQVAFKPDLTGEGNKQQIEIKYAFDLSDQAIQAVIDGGDARFGFEIACPGTAIRTVELLDEAGVFQLDPNVFYDRIVFSPRIFVLNPINEFQSKNFNPEFGDRTYQLEPGDILATVDDEVIFVDFGRMDFSSLITVERSDQRHPWTYDFGLDGDSIIISMGDDFFKLWNATRISKQNLPFLIMSVYKDCFVAAIDYLVKSDEFPEHAWSRAFNDMISKTELKLPEEPSYGAINELAQKLLLDKGPRRINLQ
jgi:hypothetical protein